MTQDQAARRYADAIAQPGRRPTWNREDFDAGWNACGREVLAICEAADAFPRATAHGLARRLRAIINETEGA